MSITVIFMGLVYFHSPDGRPGTRRVLMPDGRAPDVLSGIPPHFAGFLILSGDVTSPDGTWDPEDDGLTGQRILEFRITEPTTVRIQQAVGGVDTSAHDNRLPRLSGRGTPPFGLNRLNPQTIVSLTISGGVLEASSFHGAVVSRWTTGDSGPTTIRAGQKTLEVRENAEVLFVNTSNLLAEPDPGGSSHFVLYARLASEPRPRSLDEPRASLLAPLETSHRFVAEVAANFNRARIAGVLPLPLPGCSNTCC